MKHHALFVIFEKAAKSQIAVFCKLLVALYDYTFKDSCIMWTYFDRLKEAITM